MALHRVPASPETVRWGLFDANFPPVIEIDSGDTVVLECVSGAPEVMPPAGSGLKTHFCGAPGLVRSSAYRLFGYGVMRYIVPFTTSGGAS